MLIHEFQARRLLFEEGIDSPAGRTASSPGEAESAFLDLAPPAAMVKGQVRSVGRRQAGLVRRVEHPPEVREAAREMLSRRSPPGARAGRASEVRQVLIVEEVAASREVFLRARVEPASGELLVEVLGDVPEPIGGPVAAEPFSPGSGLKPYQARKLASAAEVGGASRERFCEVLVAVSRALLKFDAEFIELHPLGLLDDGGAMALDVKVSIDHRASFRHPDISRFSDGTEEDLRIVRARRCGLSFVPLSGAVACVAAGPDLAAAAADAVTAAGGEAACLLELGGAVVPTQIAGAFRLLSGEAALESVVVWLFGLDQPAASALSTLRASLEGLAAELPVAVYASGPGVEDVREFLAGISPGPRVCSSLAEAAAFAVRPEGGPR